MLSGPVSGPVSPIPHSFLVKLAQHVGSFLDLVYGDVEYGNRDCRRVATGPSYLGRTIDVPQSALSSRWGLDAEHSTATATAAKVDTTTVTPTPLMRVATHMVLGEFIEALREGDTSHSPPHPACLPTLIRVHRLVQLSISLYGVRALLQENPQSLVALPSEIRVKNGKIPPTPTHTILEGMLQDVHAELPPAASMTQDVLRSLREVMTPTSVTGAAKAPPRFTRVTQKVNLLLLCLGSLSGQLLTIAAGLARTALFVASSSPSTSQADKVALRIDSDTSALIQELTGDVVDEEQAPKDDFLSAPPLSASQQDWLRSHLPQGAELPTAGFLRTSLQHLKSQGAPNNAISERLPAAHLMLDLLSTLGEGVGEEEATRAQEKQRANQLTALQEWFDAEGAASSTMVANVERPSIPVDQLGLDFSPRTQTRHVQECASNCPSAVDDSKLDTDDVYSETSLPTSQKVPRLRTSRLFEAIENSQTSAAGQKRQRSPQRSPQRTSAPVRSVRLSVSARPSTAFTARTFK